MLEHSERFEEPAELIAVYCRQAMEVSLKGTINPLISVNNHHSYFVEMPIFFWGIPYTLLTSVYRQTYEVYLGEKNPIESIDFRPDLDEPTIEKSARTVRVSSTSRATRASWTRTPWRPRRGNSHVKSMGE